MRQYKPRVCELCGKEFIPTASNQRFCPECKTTARKLYDYNYQRTVRRPDRIKICARCGKEFYAKRLKEKYCPECRILVEREYARRNYERHREQRQQSNKKWEERHKEQVKAYKHKWYEEHKEIAKERERQRYRNRREQINEQNRQWAKAHPDKVRETKKKYKHKKLRKFGFIPLNKPFQGSEAHHLDRTYVIYIPAEVHKSIRHSVLRNRNMDEINAIAWNYL